MYWLEDNASSVQIKIQSNDSQTGLTMKTLRKLIFIFGLMASVFAVAQTTDAPKHHYQNFLVSIYIPVSIVNKFAEPGRLESEWQKISSQVNVDKVYIESQRSRELASDELLENVKKFFVGHGVQVAGGITWSDVPDGWQFRSFCYTDPKDREFIKKASEQLARHFDEIILDDFYFVTTKNESDIKAKGNRSWTDFRLELLNDAARKLIVGPAKAVNPKVKVIVKYPNWYEHFAGLGFDLDQGPKIFDGIYTGTETRDPNGTNQFLQQYESYQIIRYFENIAPGRNGGGWVDTYGVTDVDRYAEQLWDTVFAKAKEMTLFQWSDLLKPAEPGRREAWQFESPSFDYQQMLKHVKNNDSSTATMARVAGYALDQVDPVISHLGQPIGIKSYRPPHATGEDFLHNYLGLIGIPVDLYPTFPEDASTVLLTEDAKNDPKIVERIKQHLRKGNDVIITSGLYQALQGHGIEDIVELNVSGRRFLADGYATGFAPLDRHALSNKVTGAAPVLFPQVDFLTNDAWALVNGMSDGVGYPLMLIDRYGDHGHLFVWTIPDNFHNLYQLPVAVTTAIKNVVMKGFPVRLDGPAQVSLFAYDNKTLVVQSFLNEATHVKVSTLGTAVHLHDLVTGEVISGQLPAKQQGYRQAAIEDRISFDVSLSPHSYRAFAIEP